MLDVKSLQNYYNWYDYLLNNPAGFIWPNECELTWIVALIKLLLQINKRANKKAQWHQDETTLFFRVLHILSIRITIEKWHEYCDEMPNSLYLKINRNMQKY